ncbi:SDR family oxidoreductase [Achromobacter sp. GG226]|uniref:SDR family oxidoreductase n=1 Tax=Verticiella alkaliphila TaxID=2779529 RepID=UPI001C0BCA12|nr:SDR family oxidoreductase [Verticiella sp. GG226]MBU4610407.1 SDR family oxidoreductase [Verticiella sp. GG226]
MPHADPRPAALLVGADLPFGSDIARALDAAGFDVVAPGVPASLTPGLTWLGPIPNDDLAAGVPAEIAARLDVLVINAPVQQAGLRFLEVSDAAFACAMQRQLLGPAAWVRACLPWLKTQAGRIVHVGSRGAQGAWGGAHDMAGSAGIVGLTRSLALEFAEHGVRANAVAADFVPADGAPAQADAVARAVVYLAQPGEGPSGHTVLIDGLRSLRLSEARRR